MKKLAVRKECGQNPLGGFHYMLHPIECDDLQAKVFKLMGYVIVEVDGDTAKRLVNAARDAMLHQLEVAAITEEAIKKGKP